MAAFSHLDTIDYYFLVCGILLLILGSGIMGVTVSLPVDSSFRNGGVIISIILIVIGILFEISVVNRANKKIKDIEEDLEIEKNQSYVRDLENQIRIIELQIKIRELEEKLDTIYKKTI